PQLQGRGAGRGIPHLRPPQLRHRRGVLRRSHQGRVQQGAALPQRHHQRSGRPPLTGPPPRGREPQGRRGRSAVVVVVGGGAVDGGSLGGTVVVVGGGEAKGRGR